MAKCFLPPKSSIEVLLVEHFMKMFAGEMGIEHPEISSKALSELKAYSFPGNV